MVKITDRHSTVLQLSLTGTHGLINIDAYDGVPKGTISIVLVRYEDSRKAISPEPEFILHLDLDAAGAIQLCSKLQEVVYPKKNEL